MTKRFFRAEAGKLDIQYDVEPGVNFALPPLSDLSLWDEDSIQAIMFNNALAWDEALALLDLIDVRPDKTYIPALYSYLIYVVVGFAPGALPAQWKLLEDGVNNTAVAFLLSIAPARRGGLGGYSQVRQSQCGDQSGQ